MSTSAPATDIIPYFVWQNFGGLSGNTLSASSEQAQFPVEHIVDPLRSKRWRSKLGWNIVAGFNDRLNFTEGTTGDATASITAGNYATGALLAAEIQTQMNTAATDNSYTVTYSATTFKFTIARDTGTDTIGLEWDTGPNTDRSIGGDIGFDISADDTGATTYTGDNANYKSREWVKIIMAAQLDVKVALSLDYNFEDSDTITIEGNSSDAWVTPAFTQALSDERADDTLRLKYFSATQTYQYWRVLIEDQQYNTRGFTEIGLFFFGGYLQLSRDFTMFYTEGRNEMSEPLLADQGAPYLNVKPSPKGWVLNWPAITETDKDNLHTLQDNMKINRGFFFSFAPSTGPEKTEFVKLVKPMKFKAITHQLFETQVVVEQALG